jgi:DNA mismatch repair protein MutH
VGLVQTNTFERIRAGLAPFVGVPFAELAERLGVQGIDLPAEKRKAFGGNMVEAMLGIARNSLPDPDLASIGAEVKSIPLFPDGRPRENTKITSLTLRLVADEADFFTSHLYRKLRTILFLPIHKTDNARPHGWYLRPPFLWLPSTEQLDVIRHDHATYLGAIRERRWDMLSLSHGRYLGVNTSGQLTRGMAREDKSYAWWLKKELTTMVLRDNLDPFA